MVSGGDDRMSTETIAVEGIVLQRIEGWTAPGVYDDNDRPDIRDIFDLDYKTAPIDFEYEKGKVYGIYCCVRCDNPEIVPFINGFLIRRKERFPIETKYAPMWQDKKHKNFFAYLYEWPSKHETWREPLTYIFEMCLGYRGINASAGIEPTWLVKSCKEKKPADTSDNSNKFKITITRYKKS